MDGKKKKNTDDEMSIINSLYYNKNNKDDRELIEIVNEYTRCVKGLKPKAAFRSFVLNFLPREIQRLRASNEQAGQLNQAG